MQTKPSFIAAATSSSSNDSWAITWHQWQAAYPTDSRIGTSPGAASARASGVRCCQGTGLSAWWRRDGLVAAPTVLTAGLIRCTPASGLGVRVAVVDGLVGLGVVAVERLRQLL